MTPRSGSASPTRTARTIGALYLLIFFVGPFAFFMGRVGVVVPGDPTATVEALRAAESSFRLGMVAETVIVLVEIVVSALLFVLFAPVSRAMSLAAALARFAQAVVQAVNLLTAVPALLLLGGANYLGAFDAAQRDALVLLFMDVNAFVILVWGLIFGFHLLLLGYLVHRSGFLPKLIGILLFIGGLGYLAQSYGHLLAPEYDPLLANAVIVLSIPGELALTVWLLWKGVDEERWRAIAAEQG